MSQWTTVREEARQTQHQPAKPTRHPTTLEQRRLQREERTFRQGQDSARALVRALAVPDRTTQLAIAKVLIDAGKRASSVIAQEHTSAYDLVRWEPGSREADAVPDLRKWHVGPDAFDAEPADDLPVTIPA